MRGPVTVMCAALLVLRVGTATGHRTPLESCVQQCRPRCTQLLAQRVESSLSTCCDCHTLCVTSCDVHLKPEAAIPVALVSNNKTAEDNSPKTESQQIPCVNGKCGLPESVWRHMSITCASCRTKRRPRAPLRELALIARSVGIDLGDLSPEVGKDGSEVDEGSGVSNPQIWDLRLKSLAGGESTVLVEVAWDSALPAGSCYLITWQVEELSAVRGNLLTNSTSASLSLLPNTVYHIQVTSVSTGDTSECLLVDTHARPSFQPLASSRGEVLAGAVAAAAVVLAVLSVAALSSRLRHRTVKGVDRLTNNTHFKLYPPPITLLKLPSPPPSGTLPPPLPPLQTA